jgi:hypothetical protein
VADSAAPHLTESEKAEAVDAGARSLARAVVGEWPKFLGGSSNLIIYHGESESNGVVYEPNGETHQPVWGYTHNARFMHHATAEEARAWLAANYYPDAAKQARGDDPLRGARVGYGAASGRTRVELSDGRVFLLAGSKGWGLDKPECLDASCYDITPLDLNSEDAASLREHLGAK